MPHIKRETIVIEVPAKIAYSTPTDRGKAVENAKESARKFLATMAFGPAEIPKKEGKK